MTGTPFENQVNIFIDALDQASKKDLKQADESLRTYMVDQGNPADRRRTARDVQHLVKNMIRRF
jgi:hypothetical protein